MASKVLRSPYGCCRPGQSAAPHCGDVLAARPRSRSFVLGFLVVIVRSQPLGPEALWSGQAGFGLGSFQAREQSCRP
jgi:hypothetical protein